MRVVAGTLGGRVLHAPRGSATRPTSDRVREALFSILASVEGARVLDLFAGSGALGIEALSRGAVAATFVDSAPPAVAAVRANLDRLGLASPDQLGLASPDQLGVASLDQLGLGHLGQRAEVIRMPALRALACSPVLGRQYDLVFLDPPYRMASALGPQLSAALPPILAEGARVVVESDRRAPLELDLTLLRERQYRDTLIRVHVAG